VLTVSNRRRGDLVVPAIRKISDADPWDTQSQKENKTMSAFLRTSMFVVAAGFGLVGCGGSAPSADTSIGACQEAMRINALQLKSDEESTQRLVEGCEQGMFEHGATEWKCVAAAMKGGKKYLAATDECFKK
jgi:hypothetical protein